MKQCFAWWSVMFGRDHSDAARVFAGAAETGFTGIEMVPRAMHSLAAKHGLALVTSSAHAIERGFNDPTHHAELHSEVRTAIEQAADDGVANLIVFSGNRGGRPDDEAVAACADGLASLATVAHDAGVTLLLEILNSKVDHPDYHADTSAFAFGVTRAVDHPGLRVLFDCYHVQLMEGDLLRTIKDNLDLIGHVHTAGVPGRRDLDDRQEINWRAVAGQLRHSVYTGWVGHEFVPRSDPVAALRHAYNQFEEPS